MSDKPPKDLLFVLRSQINSFWYLYGDAETLHQLAKSPQLADNFQRVPLSRTAILLYIFSLEALINRALARFLESPVREFVMERENRFSLEEKWAFLPKLSSDDTSTGFDEGTYPWSHFRELISLRNDFVHPKHDRFAYYRALS